ncbi:hypothetical protein IWW34DRAFT_812527 [Fusarium oxysporum f. sp. albedinis]|nr:hypothetical protein IWW34DRAFT_812527 [Fusarium oxysporum f. sp. albedinis]
MAALRRKAMLLVLHWKAMALQEFASLDGTLVAGGWAVGLDEVKLLPWAVAESAAGRVGAVPKNAAESCSSLSHSQVILASPEGASIGSETFAEVPPTPSGKYRTGGTFRI